MNETPALRLRTQDMARTVLTLAKHLTHRADCEIVTSLHDNVMACESIRVSVRIPPHSSTSVDGLTSPAKPEERPFAQASGKTHDDALRGLLDTLGAELTKRVEKDQKLLVSLNDIEEKEEPQ